MTTAIKTNGIGQRTTSHLPKSKGALPIDPCEVRRLFDYDPGSGILTWKVKVWRSPNNPGDRVGTVSRTAGGKPIGEVVGIQRKRYLVHRIIWVWMTGKDIPDGFEIDHRNRDPLDNTWVNLRMASPSQNLRNTLRKRDLPKGVYRARRGLYRSQIRVSGVAKNLGHFATIEEAEAAFAIAHKEISGEFSCTGGGA